ncbi:MAG TPA: amidase [Chiayiivirga sp.]|nr:amidase [Chiayiivirga sp.]
MVLVTVLAGCNVSLTSAPARSSTPATAPTAKGVAIEEVDIASLQSRMQSGALDSQRLTQAYLTRIEAIDRKGPALNSIITTNPDALTEAAALDAERRTGKLRGPLHGIPVLLKDNIDARPMATTAGSLALIDNIPASDAFLVARLRAAGAVILGKTNLSEWANFRSTRAISGWSGVGGQTRNPYVLDRNPCGSSSGTGTAIAASLAAVGVGTETDGSIICPSAVAGLVGIKPTVGAVSRSGIVPIAISQDTAGPMARSVADAAALLSVMAVPDPADPAAAKHPGVLDYSVHLKADGLRGARIGVLRKAMGLHPDVDAATEAAIAALKAAGATVVDAEITTAGQWDAAELQVLLFEFKDGLGRYLASHQRPVNTFTDLIAFNREHAAQEMPWFGQELFEMAEGKGPLTEPGYLGAKKLAFDLAGPQGIDATLKAQQLDALVAPSTAPAWPTDRILGDHYLGGGYGAAAVAGYPSITVPMGDSHGLPLGLVFMGAAWSEGRLIELAYGFEQATHKRQAPRYLPTLDVADTGAAR